MGIVRRVLSLGAALGLVLAACGRGAQEGPRPTVPAPTGTVSGTIQVWAMGTEGENLHILAEDFMAQHPGVEVQVTAVPWDAAHDKIVNAIAGGQVPDVSLIGTTWMGEFATLGGLDPTPSTIDSSQFFEGAWNTTVVDGVSYGVPWYVETRLLYYRTDLAQKAGFTQPPANWDELKELVKGMVQAGAKYGIALQPGGTGSWQTFLPFLWQKGGEVLDESGAFALDSPACVEALTYYDSFFEEGLSPTEPGELPLEGAFAQGQIGSFMSGPWMIGIITDAGADPNTWALAHQPRETSATSFVGGGDLAVFAQSDNKPTAWAFVEYLSRPEVQVKWYQTTKDLPAVRAAWEDPSLAGDPLLSAFGEQLKDAKHPPAIPTWEQVAAAIDTQVEQVTLGDTTPEDGCRAMQAEASAIGTGA